jgi:hypothetical protein
MSSVTALDNQIRKKKRAIKEAKGRLQTLEAQRAQLSEEYRERSENYERIKERVRHAGEEIRTKSTVIQDLREQLRIKQGGGFTAPGLEEFSLDEPSEQGGLFVHDSGESMSSEEMVSTSMVMLMEQMQSLQKRVRGQDAATDALEAANRAHPPLNVAVCYQRLGDYCSFRVTPEYTFEQLNRDACKYWEVPVEDGTLRDHLNLMWPPQATVASEMRKYDEPPKINLIARIKVADTIADEPGAGTPATSGHQPLGSHADDASDTSDDDEEEAHAHQLIKEWRYQNYSKLSPLFHTPRLVAERNFRSLNDSGSSEEKEVADYLAIWIRMLTYACFMYFLISSIQIRRAVPITNAVHNSLKATFTRRAFPSALQPDVMLDFNSMHTIDDVWQWMEGPMIEALFPDMHYNEQAMTSEEERYVLRANRLVGGVRMRQYRSGKTKRTGGCAEVMPALQGVAVLDSVGCYNEYSMDHQRMYVASLGSDQAFGPGKEHDGFVFKRGELFNSFSFFSGVSFYSRDSFVTELPADRGKAKALLWHLRESRWLDDSTRGLMITFNLFNTNYYSVTAVKLFLEFSPTGGLVKETTTNTIWLSFYSKAGGGTGQTSTFLMWADSVMFVYVLVTLYTTMWEVALYGVNAYFACVWNVTDVLLCAGITTQLIYQIIFDFVRAREVDLSVPHYVHLEAQVDMYLHGINISVFNMLLAAASSFKLLQRNLSVSKIWQTLDIGGGVFLSFLFVFAVVGYTFLVISHFSFGPEVESFSTLMGATNSLLVMITGSVDYAHIRTADDFMAPMFFTLFNVTVNFFLASIFFAVVNDSYAITNLHFDDTKSHFWKHILSAPVKVVRQKWRERKNGGGGKTERPA